MNNAALTAGNTMRLTSNGERVRIVGVDSDPRCDVLVCSVDDPDCSFYVQRDELAGEAAPSNRWKRWTAERRA